MRIDEQLIDNSPFEGKHKRNFEFLKSAMDQQQIDVEAIIRKLQDFQIAVPSWALGTGGTRFGRFSGGGEPRNLEEKIEDVAIFRVEQLHPLPKNKILEALKAYENAEIIWVQEEPENMGYWTYIVRMLYKYLKMDVIARKHSASPATGYMKVHIEEQKGIVNKALRIK